MVTHVLPPEESPAPSVQLYGRTLLLARVAWFSLAAMVLTMLLGIPTRLAALQQTAPPFPGGGLVLPIQLLPALDSWGISHSAYAAWIFSSETLVTATFFLAAAFLFWRRGTDRGAFFVSLVLLSYGATETTFGSGIATLTPLWHWPFETIQAIGAAMIIVVFCTFPDGRFTLPWARPLTLGWCALVFVWLLFPDLPLNVVNGDSFNRTPFLSLGFALLWNLAALYALLHRYRHAQGTLRLQMQWMVYALAVVFVTTSMRYTIDPLLWLIPIEAHPRWAVLRLMLLRPIYSLTLLVVPVACTIAILRYKLWGIETVIRRTLLYTALSLTLSLCALGAILVSQTLLRGLSGLDTELIAVFTTLLCVLLFDPLRRRFQGLIDHRFDRTTVDFRPAVIAFGRELNHLHTTSELLEALLVRSATLLKITYGALYLRDAGGAFPLAHAHQTPPDTPTTLAQHLAQQLTPDTEVQRPRDPYWPLLIPLVALHTGERIVIGVLTLGPRRSEEPYSRAVIDLLLTLADRTGTAVAIAQLVTYQLSPAGRAEALAQQLVRAPEAALGDLYRLTQGAFASADEAARLAALPQALRASNAPRLADLAGGYRLIAESRIEPTLLLAGLRLLTSTFVEPSPDAPQPDGIQSLFQLCRDALEITHVDEIGTLLPRIQALDTVSADQRLALPLYGAITVCWRAIQLITALRQLDTPAVQLVCLRQTRDQLAQIGGQLPLGLDLVERHIADQIAQRWRVCVEAHMQTLQGQARLALRLVTGSVSMAAETMLGVEVSNRGQGAAHQITLQLLPGDGYLAHEPEQLVDDLGSGDAVVITFAIHLLGAPRIYPSLRVTYADATETEAPLTMRLQVTVLAVPR